MGGTDNVAVVKHGIRTGAQVELSDGRILEVNADIGPGHRFAINEIPAGEFVRQYDQPIGTSCGLGPGDAVTETTMNNEVPVIRDLPDNLSNPGPEYIEPLPTFPGFLRPDGRTGTRNFRRNS